MGREMNPDSARIEGSVVVVDASMTTTNAAADISGFNFDISS
jgi:hypothetical protein